MQDFTPTPHNAAKKGEIAKTVLMPGDPLRAKYVAENFMENARLVSSVRNCYCYTGTYQGRPVSVMSSGMGCPSIGIYSYELFNFYDVDAVIRIGSAGSLQPYVHMRDLVIGMSAATNSSFADSLVVPGTPTFCADFGLLEKAVQYARANNISFHVGPILSSDNFYNADQVQNANIRMGVLAVEMEAAALYANAMSAGKKALALCTITDAATGDKTKGMTPEERERSLNEMILTGLSLA